MLGGGIGGIILFFIVIGVGEGEGDDGEGFLEVIWLGVDGFVFDGDIEVLYGLGEGGGECCGEGDFLGEGVRIGDWELDLDLV